MRVLQINQSDVTGGAAIAAYRLHQGLLRQGIGSKLLVGHVQSFPLLWGTVATFGKPICKRRRINQ